MKQLSFFLFLLFSGSCLYAGSPGRVTKCLSGNCENGIGEAQLDRNDNFTGSVYYSGTFKNGLMNGDGMSVWDGTTGFIGHFREGFRDGYGMQVGMMPQASGKFVIDSASVVIFGKWDDDYDFKGIGIEQDGMRRVRTSGHKYLKTEKVKDHWINEQADAWLARRSGKFAAPAKATHELLELATRIIPVARDRWSECITWDCLTDRQYYIDVTSQEKYHAMPFGGHVTVQVVAADNTVAFEAEAGTYWTPRTDGKYTFQLKFYQDKILGDWREHSSYVDGMRLQWYLKSLRKL